MKLLYTNEVDKILLCKYCEGRLDIPQCLPCGKAICSLCETTIQILEKNKFDCLICKKKHEMPQDGLPIMKPLLNLLSIKPVIKNISFFIYFYLKIIYNYK